MHTIHSETLTKGRQKGQGHVGKIVHPEKI